MTVFHEAQGDHTAHAEQFKARDQKITNFDLGHPSEQLKAHQQRQIKPEENFSKIATLGFPSIELVTGGGHRSELPKAANAEVSHLHNDSESKPRHAAADDIDSEKSQSRDLTYDKDGVPYQPKAPLPNASVKENYQYAADQMSFLAWCAAHGGHPGHKQH